MAKLVSTFVIVSILFAIISGWMEGSGGIEAIQLSSDVSATATTIPTADTSSFLDSDVLAIDDEYFYYPSKTATTFSNVTRGYWDSTPEAHRSGAYIYTEGAAAVNKAMGFNVAAIGVSNGLYTVATVPFRFFTVTLPYLIFYQFAMFDGEIVVLIRYVLMALGIGVYVVLGVALGQVVGYALRR